jgi:hypothetical protein
VKPSTSAADADLQAALALLDNKVVAPAGRVLGAPQVFRSIGRGPKVPATDLQFRRSEQIHVEWSRPDQPMQELSARLLGRDGRPLAVPVAVVDHANESPFNVSADCSLAPLAPGDYVIEVRANVAGAQVRALVAFRLIR